VYGELFFGGRFEQQAFMTQFYKGAKQNQCWQVGFFGFKVLWKTKDDEDIIRNL
jgi:hypothetical protein